MRDPKAIIFEDVTIAEGCTLTCGDVVTPLPAQHIDWWCSCGHASRQEHEADEVPLNS